jgi:hypothetical protein
MSRVDHILSSTALDNVINNVIIMNDVIVSDHRPLSFSVQCNICCSSSSSSVTVSNLNIVPHWGTCDDATLSYYANYLDKLLDEVPIPYSALYDLSGSKTFHSDISKFYNDISTCISKAVADVIPGRKRLDSNFNVPGWNTYVQEKHEAAREAFLAWVDAGRQRYGHYFDKMKQTRALFKLALRYCKNHIEELKANACADSMFDKDSRKFWNNVYKVSNNKSSCHVNNVGGATGSQNIADMWKTHFEQLYSTRADSKFRVMFEDKLKSYTMTDNPANCYFTMLDIFSSLNKQKRGKSPGPDGINMEAFIFSGHKLKVYLSILFNLFLLHGYVPNAFHQATIIPLVKSKSGDLADVSNYRAIALSNSITKILESLLYAFIESHDSADEYQFGFKKNHSTSFCTHILKKTVDHYRQNGSHVFACFIDFNKAFDNVDFWLLFCKLVDNNPSNTCHIATRLLAYWYSSQQMSVRWQNSSSDCFNIFN